MPASSAAKPGSGRPCSSYCSKTPCGTEGTRGAGGLQLPGSSFPTTALASASDGTGFWGVVMG
ncbi:hypothetical protein [Corynebacterium appendicis]|uniref:hypothetical protein n=1 Tax=Corynebacterium appendicis TaxID=163202 RepID=UPI0023534B87|nr:hypothetical protein [Corynebacterium appendicis]